MTTEDLARELDRIAGLLVLTPDQSEACMDAAARLRELSAGWQTIDSAPRDGTVVLLWFDGVIHQGQYVGPSDGAIYSGSPSRYNWFSLSCGSTLSDTSVSHWRPLPQPPGDAG